MAFKYFALLSGEEIVGCVQHHDDECRHWTARGQHIGADLPKGATATKEISFDEYRELKIKFRELHDTWQRMSEADAAKPKAPTGD